MARRMTGSLRGEADGMPDLSALRLEMKRLRAEIEKASDHAATRSRAEIGRLGDVASERVSELLKEGDELLGDIGRELTRFEERTGAVVRERPLQAVGLALVAGFALALLFRR